MLADGALEGQRIAPFREHIGGHRSKRAADMDLFVQPAQFEFLQADGVRNGCAAEPGCIDAGCDTVVASRDGITIATLTIEMGYKTMEILRDLENFMVTEIIARIGRKSLSPDENLLEQGLIDSFGLMKLITFIEEKYVITVLDEEIVPENFQQLSCIANLIERKRLKN
jgi:acyl carrier protein